MSDLNHLNPSDIGIYITSEGAEADPIKVAKNMKRSYEKFGFKDRKEFVEYIKENVDIEDYVMIYSFDKQFNQTILRPICCGSKDELFQLFGIE